MMMEPPPPAALEMIEPELVLELLIVALDAPAQLGEPNEVGDRRRRRQRRQPILRGLRFASRPMDQQPLLRPGGGPGPVQRLGGRGASPGGHAVVSFFTPTA